MRYEDFGYARCPHASCQAGFKLLLPRSVTYLEFYPHHNSQTFRRMYLKELPCGDLAEADFDFWVRAQ